MTYKARSLLTTVGGFELVIPGISVVEPSFHCTSSTPKVPPAAGNVVCPIRSWVNAPDARFAVDDVAGVANGVVPVSEYAFAVNFPAAVPPLLSTARVIRYFAPGAAPVMIDVTVFAES